MNEERLNKIKRYFNAGEYDHKNAIINELCDEFLIEKDKKANIGWHDARSKTVYLDPDNKTQISSRQYVLYTPLRDDIVRTDKEKKLIADIRSKIKDKVDEINADSEDKLKCIGFSLNRI